MPAHDPLFVFAGEPSGDAHGALLLRALKQLEPNTPLIGVGGPHMRKEGLDALMPTEQFCLMGITEVLAKLPSLYQHYRQLKKEVLDRQPKAVILIDYPGFNLRFARGLRRHGYRGQIVQYISPTVWAWKKGRVRTIADNYDMLLTIFPFEADYYAHTSLSVHYVGHPLVDEIAQHHTPDEWRKKHQLGDKQIVGIFPGSRRGEITSNLPKQLDACRQWAVQHPDTAFMVSLAREDHRSLISKLIAQYLPGTTIVDGAERYSLMRHCHLAVATSGTVTLELAIHHVPTVVTYNLSLLNRLILRWLFQLNLPHYCIVNILAGKTVYPELMKYTPQVADIVNNLNHLYNQHQSIAEACQEVSDSLNEGIGLEGGARQILEACHA